MTSFFEGWNAFVQLPWIQYLILNCNWVDWVTLTCLVVGLLYGFRKGLMRMLVEIMELLIIIFLIIEYGDAAAERISTAFPKISLWMVQVLVMISGCVLLGLIIGFVDKILQKWIHSELVSPLKMAGGALCGGFYFLLLWSLCTHIMLIPVSGQQLSAQYSSTASKTGGTVIRLVPESYRVISEAAGYISEGARTVVRKGKRTKDPIPSPAQPREQLAAQ